MGIKERVIEFLGGEVPRERAIGSTIYNLPRRDGNDDPASGDIAAGGFGYEAMTGGGYEPGVSFDEALEAARALKSSSGIVQRVGAIKTGYIVGSGPTVTAQDEGLQAVLDKFWRINKLGVRVTDFVRQWSDYGVQVFPVFVRRTDGEVRLGYIDPANVQRIVQHPENDLEMWAVVVKGRQSPDPWVQPHGVRVYRIVRDGYTVVLDEEGDKLRATQRHRALECPQCQALSDLEARACEYCGAQFYEGGQERAVEAVYKPEFARAPISTEGMKLTCEQATLEQWEHRMLRSYGLDSYTGSCFYWRKNADSNQGMGRSDYTAVADYNDQHDETMFALGDREQLANLVVGDLMVDTSDPADVQEQSEQFQGSTIKPGSVYAHNAQTELEFKAPDLKQAASVETARAQLAYILGSLGIPVPWFGRGDETSRATAQAQGDPTWKTLQHEQGIVRAHLVEWCEFVRDQAILAGAYHPGPDDDASIEVSMPEMVPDDVVSLSQSASAIINAIQVGLAVGVLDWPAAVALAGKALSEFDVDLDTAALLEQGPPESPTAFGLGEFATAPNGQQLFSSEADDGDA